MILRISSKRDNHSAYVCECIYIFHSTSLSFIMHVKEILCRHVAFDLFGLDVKIIT